MAGVSSGGVARYRQRGLGWAGRGGTPPCQAKGESCAPPSPGLRLYSQLVRLRGARGLPGIVVRELNSPVGACAPPERRGPRAGHAGERSPKPPLGFTSSSPLC